MLDHPLSCTEVSSEYGISWADLEINHHAAPKFKKIKIHAAFIMKLPQVFFPSLLPICKIAKTALTVLIMLWDKPWQFSYRILLHSGQSKWWVKSKQRWYQGTYKTGVTGVRHLAQLRGWYSFLWEKRTVCLFLPQRSLLHCMAGHTHKSLPVQQHHSSHLNQQVTGNTGGDSFEYHSFILRTQYLLTQSFKF